MLHVWRNWSRIDAVRLWERSSLVKVAKGAWDSRPILGLFSFLGGTNQHLPKQPRKPHLRISLTGSLNGVVIQPAE
jgi:hypothetical protein